jgi:hypothetical protein
MLVCFVTVQVHLARKGGASTIHESFVLALDFPSLRIVYLEIYFMLID